MISKFKAFRIRLSIYLGSYRGKTIFNLFYGLGASIAITGVLFKLLYLDGASIMLAIGLGTEAILFALSALEPPYRNYHWENVFPVLKSNNAADKPDLDKIVQQFAQEKTGPFINEGTVSNVQAQPQHASYVAHTNPVGNITSQQARENYGIPSQVPISEEDAQTLTESIKKMGEAVTQLNNLADITVVTENYISKLSGMADNLNRFSEATGSLAEVFNVLLDSYKNVTENSDEISANSKGYVEQMGNLNRNLSGLNTIYEIQLKSISSQIDTIDRVNKGLVHIREMYETSAGDSDRFSKETEAMAENLARLNTVYSRMLEAMAPNFVFGNMMASTMGARMPESPKTSAEDKTKVDE
jgi:gliding motility-associated protein GldL